MPIPELIENETREDFIERCVSQLAADGEFESNEQRVAVCNTAYEADAENEKKERSMKQKSFSFKAVESDTGKRIVLTKEVRDRDGEILSIDGAELDNYKANPGLFFGHKALDGSLYDMIGVIEDLRIETDKDGIKMITGRPRFARHQVAQDAKQMWEDGILITGSVGFIEKGYEIETKTVTHWELLEYSLVGVPSNTEAKVIKKLEEENNKLARKLLNHDEIHPRIKEYRKLFLSNELMEKLGYEKTGNEIIDVKNVYDLLTKELDAEPKEEEKVTEPEEKPEDEVVAVEETPTTEEAEENPEAEEATKEPEVATKEDITNFLTELQEIAASL